MNWEIYNTVPLAIVMTIHVPKLLVAMWENWQVKREFRKANEELDRALLEELATRRKSAELTHHTVRTPRSHEGAVRTKRAAPQVPIPPLF